jgi:SAM-dependent methyltransferase
MVQPFMAGWSHALLEVAALEPGQHVLDIACGTGVVTRLAASRVGSGGAVVGVDLNAGMLALARMLPLQAGTAVIAWHATDATTLPWAEATFDEVLCQQGLQFFPDQPGVLRAMRRVVRPTGRVVLSVWRSLEHCPWQRAVATALERHVSAAAAAPLHAPFALGEEADALRTLLTGAGFRRVHLWIESRLTRYGSPEALVPGFLAATPVAACIASLEDTTRAALVRDVLTALRSYCDDDGLAVPMETHVVVATP